MTDHQKQIVRDTFAQIERQSDIVALVFYQRLFTLDPSLRALFHTDIEKQAQKLMVALKFAVESLDDAKALASALHAMGRRHVYYGVHTEHYETVGAALMWTLAHSLETQFTSAAEEAWGTLYRFLADTMIQGAASVPVDANPAQRSPPIQNGGKTSSEE